MLSDKTITIILSSWKRPHLLAAQVDAFKAQSHKPAELWLWADRSDTNANESYEGIDIDRTFLNNTNLGVYGRFAVGLLARTAFVGIFDDDMLPGNKYLENCLSTINASNAIVAAAGVRFIDANYLPSERFGWVSQTGGIIEVDVGCNAWFLKKEWLSYLWQEPPFDWFNGEDLSLSYLAQKYGKIKTVVPPQAEEQYRASVKILGRDDVAISSSSDHYELRTKQLREQIKNGWRTIRGVSL